MPLNLKPLDKISKPKLPALVSSALVVSACKYPDLKKRVQVYFKHYFGHSPEVIMVDHQLSHLASAYFPSNFNISSVICPS